MTTVTLKATGAADAGPAWQRYEEIARWTDWAPQIRRVDCAADRIAAGVTGRVVGLAGFGVDFVIEAVDRDARTWSWRVRVGPVSLSLTHGVEQLPSGCRTWLRVSGPLPVVAGYAPVAAWALRRLVAR
jgi:hypothetical protein